MERSFHIKPSGLTKRKLSDSSTETQETAEQRRNRYMQHLTPAYSECSFFSNQENSQDRPEDHSNYLDDSHGRLNLNGQISSFPGEGVTDAPIFSSDASFPTSNPFTVYGDPLHPFGLFNEDRQEVPIGNDYRPLPLATETVEELPLFGEDPQPYYLLSPHIGSEDFDLWSLPETDPFIQDSEWTYPIDQPLSDDLWQTVLLDPFTHNEFTDFFSQISQYDASTERPFLPENSPSSFIDESNQPETEQETLTQLPLSEQTDCYKQRIQAGNDAKAKEKFNKPWAQLTEQEQGLIYADLIQASKDVKAKKKFNKPWAQLTEQEQGSIHADLAQASKDARAKKKFNKSWAQLTEQEQGSIHADFAQAGKDARAKKKFNKPWAQLTKQEQRSIHADFAQASKDAKAKKKFNKPWAQLTKQEQGSIHADFTQASKDAKAKKKFNKSWAQLTKQEQGSIHADFAQAGKDARAKKKFNKSWAQLTKQEQGSIHADFTRAGLSAIKEKLSNMANDQRENYYIEKKIKGKNTRKVRDNYVKEQFMQINKWNIDNAINHIDSNTTEFITKDQQNEKDYAITLLKNLATAKEANNEKQGIRHYKSLQDIAAIYPSVQAAMQMLLPTSQ